jgi:hypothetical protein
MSLITETQRTLSVSNVDDYLLNWLEAFLIDRKAEGVAEGTLRFYRQKIKLFSDYCDAMSVKQIGQITPSFLRQYLLYLEESGHNPGGRHAAFRTVRAFFLWYEDEVEPQGWSNPISKVKAPKVPMEPLEPVSFETVAQMVKACPHNSFTGDRDAAILLCLLDTGAPNAIRHHLSSQCRLLCAGVPYTDQALQEIDLFHIDLASIVAKRIPGVLMREGEFDDDEILQMRHQFDVVIGNQCFNGPQRCRSSVRGVAVKTMRVHATPFWISNSSVITYPNSPRA